MIRLMFKSLICIAKNHNYVDLGKCPFTGNNYKMCTRCQEMVTK
jgi:hypothetical protein